MPITKASHMAEFQEGIEVQARNHRNQNIVSELPNETIVSLQIKFVYV